MFRKRLMPALLALIMVLAAGCDSTEMEAFNASLRFLVTMPDNVFDETIHNSDIDLMGRQIGEMMPVLRRATPEEAAEFNRLLMQLFQRIQQHDPELARRLAAHLLRAFLGVGGPANPPQGAVWRARAGVERTGDVYDYNLEQPVQNADSARADINHVTATATNKMDAVGPLHPGGTGHPVSSHGAATPPPWWAMQGPWTGYLDASMSWGTPYSFTGDALFTYGDTALYASGADWGVTLNPDGTLTFTTGTSAHVEFHEGPASQGQHTLTTDFGGRHAHFAGFNAVIDFDAAANTLDITLAEGRVTLGEADPVEFAAPDDNTNALTLHVNPDGSVEQAQIPLWPDANQRFAPVFRSVAFTIDMVEPVAAGSAEAEQVWYLLFDLDGSPATGVGGPETNAMFTGLGADFIVDMRLQQDGSVMAGGRVFGGERADPIPVAVELSANRYTLTVYIPIADLFNQAMAAGVAFDLATFDAVRWRIASVNYSGAGEPKDIFPELDFDYGPPAEGAPAAGEPAAPRPPEGLSLSVSTSITDGGPVVRFEDKSTSPDPENPITGRLWDFGDGTTSTEQNPQHSYENAGDYEVEFTLTFANGASTSIRVPVTVTRGSGAPPAPAQPAVMDACTAATNSGANLRGGPGTDFEKVGALAAGAPVQVIGVNAAGDWYRLQVEGAPDAWIAAFLLDTPQCPEGFTLPVVAE